MGYKTLPYTFQLNGNDYLQIRLSNGRMYKKSLLTDSYREASALMIGVTPHISFVKSLATPIFVSESFLSNLIASERKAVRNPLLPHQQIAPPVEIVESASRTGKSANPLGCVGDVQRRKGAQLDEIDFNGE